MADDDDNNGGGGGDDLQARIDEATAGLKKTNAELKAEKTAAKKLADDLAAKFEKLGGDEGIERLVAMREHLEKDEVGKLLAEGKHEEWFDKRASSLKADYEKKLAAMESQIAERDELLKASNGKLHSTLLDVGIGQACDKAGIIDQGAREHARMLAERQFAFDPEVGAHVLKDDDGSVVYGKDGKQPKTMAEWVEEKREVDTYRGWWPESRSAGFNHGGLPGDPDRRMKQLGSLDMNAYRQARTKEQQGAA